MNVLWATNVYTRVNHLRLQQELIRGHFGDAIDILTFTNHEEHGEEFFGYRENFFYRCPLNSGGHTGCRDAYNYLLTLVNGSDYDFIIWSHADFTISDYSFVESLIDRMAREGLAFACLNHTTAQNPRRPWEGVVPHIHNDFFIFSTGLYRRTFPRHDDCDGWGPDGLINDCIEVALGKWVAATFDSTDNLHIIECDCPNPSEIFSNLDGTGVDACRSDEFAKHVEFIRQRNPVYYESLLKAGVLTNMLDDVRPPRAGLYTNDTIERDELARIHLQSPPTRKVRKR